VRFGVKVVEHTRPGDDEPWYACARCGSSDIEFIDCEQCNGEGGFDGDRLMEEDPLWYEGVEWENCDDCHGAGGEWCCNECPPWSEDERVAESMTEVPNDGA